jgi:hypothetical protein
MANAIIFRLWISQALIVSPPSLIVGVLGEIRRLSPPSLIVGVLGEIRRLSAPSLIVGVLGEIRRLSALPDRLRPRRDPSPLRAP